MQEEMSFPEETNAVERMLRGVAPVKAGLDRDRIMFEAGRSAERIPARRKIRLWQGVCGVLVLLGGAGGAVSLWPREAAPAPPQSIAGRPNPGGAAAVVADGGPRVERPVVRSIQFNRTSELGGVGSYLQLRDRVLAVGVVALPASVGQARENGDSAGMPRSESLNDIDASPAWQRKAAGTPGGKS